MEKWLVKQIRVTMDLLLTQEEHDRKTGREYDIEHNTFRRGEIYAYEQVLIHNFGYDSLMIKKIEEGIQK